MAAIPVKARWYKVQDLIVPGGGPSPPPTGILVNFETVRQDRQPPLTNPDGNTEAGQVAYNPSTGTFTAPFDGNYRLKLDSGRGSYNSVVALTLDVSTDFSYILLKNGTTTVLTKLCPFQSHGGGALVVNSPPQAEATVALVAGDTIQVRAVNLETVVANSAVVPGDPANYANAARDVYPYLYVMEWSYELLNPPGTPNQPPTATLTGTNTSAVNGTPTTLTCTATDTDGAVVNYNFRRSTAGNSIPTESFQSGVSNIATFTPPPDVARFYRCDATDNDGAVTQSNIVAMVRGNTAPPIPNQPPTATLSGEPLVGTNGQIITLTCTAVDADSSPLNYKFYKSTQPTGITLGSPFQDSAANTATDTPYDSPDPTFYVCRVEDGDGNFTDSNTVAASRVAAPVPPVAVIEADSRFRGPPPDPYTYRFDGENSLTVAPGRVVNRYVFSVGSTGAFQDSADPVFNYTFPGAFIGAQSCSLVVYDDINTPSQNVAQVQVYNIPTLPEAPNRPPVVQLTADNYTVPQGSDITFTAVAVDPEGGAVEYDFGDGYSSADTYIRNFPDPGVYNQTVNARDPEGFSSSATVTVVITETVNQPPSAVLSADSLADINGVPVNLTCEAQDFDGVVIRYVFKRGATVVQDANDNTYSETPPNDAQTSYTCDVYDAQGATTTSNAVIVTRAATPPPPANQPPGVVLRGDSLAATNDTPIRVTATAGDVDGTVTRYVFKRNGVVIKDSSENFCDDVPTDG